VIVRGGIGVLILVFVAHQPSWPGWLAWLTVAGVAFWCWRALPIPVENAYMTPETFRQIYLHAPGATEKSEEVDLLVLAGLGAPYPPSSRFLRKAAAAANQLHIWLEQNLTATPSERHAYAQKVVDGNGVLDPSIRGIVDR
jgi:hypothetical protein